MKKLFYAAIAFFTCMSANAQEPVSYVGNVGNYKVVMELTSADNKVYTGRYRYEHEKEWLTLSGELYYDRRQINPQNLVLKEFVSTGNPMAPKPSTGEFTLYVSGDSLTGFWNKEPGGGAPGLPVVLTKGKPEPAKDFDGFYYSGDNELKVKRISDLNIEATIWIAKSAGCAGVRLTGKLIRVGNDWKGSLLADNDNGEAGVVISFSGEQANLQINPAFLAGAKCNIAAAPYVRQLRKEKGELR